MAEWCYLWLQKQHLHGIERAEAIQYLLEGAAARTDNSVKCTKIDICLKQCLVEAGIIGEDVTPTYAFQRQVTMAQVEGEDGGGTATHPPSACPTPSTPKGGSGPRKMSFGAIAHSPRGTADPLVAAQISQLKLARISALVHRDLVCVHSNNIMRFIVCINRWMRSTRWEQELRSRYPTLGQRNSKNKFVN